MDQPARRVAYGSLNSECRCLTLVDTFRYDEAVRLDPEEATAHHNRGTALYNLGRDEEALAAYDEALRLDSEFVGAQRNRGNTLEALGRYDEAQAAFDEADRLD